MTAELTSCLLAVSLLFSRCYYYSPSLVVDFCTRQFLSFPPTSLSISLMRFPRIPAIPPHSPSDESLPVVFRSVRNQFSSAGNIDLAWTVLTLNSKSEFAVSRLSTFFYAGMFGSVSKEACPRQLHRPHCKLSEGSRTGPLEVPLERVCSTFLSSPFFFLFSLFDPFPSILYIKSTNSSMWRVPHLYLKGVQGQS